jgi:hypothetical protein
MLFCIYKGTEVKLKGSERLQLCSLQYVSPPVMNVALVNAVKAKAIN